MTRSVSRGIWIARRIVDAGGHYVLNVKGNRRTLRDGIETFFAEFLDGKMPCARPPQAQQREGPWRQGITMALSLRRPARAARQRSVAWAQGDRHGHQQHRA